MGDKSQREDDKWTDWLTLGIEGLAQKPFWLCWISNCGTGAASGTWASSGGTLT